MQKIYIVLVLFILGLVAFAPPKKLQLGKVIVLEKNQDEQGKLITKLYETLKLLIEKSIRPK